LPRLLFLSLDSGSASQDPRDRTLKAVRRQNVECAVDDLPKQRHWYRTHELARALLRQFNPDLTVADTRFHFAHVNSAKCCQNNPGRRQASPILFRKCRRFISGELRILRPDVVVTQGGPAKEAILEKFDVQEHEEETTPSDARYKHDARYETGVVKLARDVPETLWISTYHPGNHGRFYPQRKHCWNRYAEAVGKFWLSRQGRR